MLCRVAALKRLHIYHPKCRLYFLFGPLKSARVFLSNWNLNIGFLYSFNFLTYIYDIRLDDIIPCINATVETCKIIVINLAP